MANRKEMLTGLKQGFESELTGINSAKEHIEKNIEIVTTIEDETDKELAAETAKIEVARAEGYKAGQDSMVMPDPSDPEAKYTQADMDQLKETVRTEMRAEFEPQIEGLKIDKDAMAAELDKSKSDVDAAKAATQDVQGKFDAYKKVVIENFDAQQSSESVSESSYGKFIRGEEVSEEVQP